MVKKKFVCWTQLFNVDPGVEKWLKRINQDFQYSHKRPKYYKNWDKVLITVQVIK